MGTQEKKADLDLALFTFGAINKVLPSFLLPLSSSVFPTCVLPPLQQVRIGWHLHGEEGGGRPPQKSPRSF